MVKSTEQDGPVCDITTTPTRENQSVDGTLPEAALSPVNALSGLGLLYDSSNSGTSDEEA